MEIKQVENCKDGLESFGGPYKLGQRVFVRGTGFGEILAFHKNGSGTYTAKVSFSEAKESAPLKAFGWFRVRDLEHVVSGYVPLGQPVQTTWGTYGEVICFEEEDNRPIIKTAAITESNRSRYAYLPRELRPVTIEVLGHAKLNAQHELIRGRDAETKAFQKAWALKNNAKEQTPPRQLADKAYPEVKATMSFGQAIGKAIYAVYEAAQSNSPLAGIVGETAGKGCSCKASSPNPGFVLVKLDIPFSYTSPEGIRKIYCLSKVKGTGNPSCIKAILRDVTAGTYVPLAVFSEEQVGKEAQPHTERNWILHESVLASCAEGQ